MMNFLIGFGIVLLLAILYLIFRIGNLVSVVKAKTPDEKDSSNGVHGYLFLAFIVASLSLFFWYSYTHFDSYVLPVASEHGAVTDNLFWITMGITVVAFVIISIVMFWFTFKYRYNRNRKAAFFPDNHYLELTWTIIPAIVLTLLIFKGLRTWNDITDPASKEAEVIELIGQQFAWTARYPGVKDNELGAFDYKMIDASNEFGLNLEDKNTYDDFKSLELHLPPRKEILLKIRAKDVLHSVFLPHFRVKMDAVPGLQTNFKFVATKSTSEMRDETGNSAFNYEMACTEICGKGHFSMKFPVFVHDTVEDYEKWKASQDSWLKQNPDYMKRVPAGLREVAAIKAGLPLEDVSTDNSVTAIQ
jgi:cytochrome c oxidase subunit 2